jgi:hypothetical protein
MWDSVSGTGLRADDVEVVARTAGQIGERRRLPTRQRLIVPPAAYLVDQLLNRSLLIASGLDLARQVACLRGIENLRVVGQRDPASTETCSRSRPRHRPAAWRAASSPHTTPATELEAGTRVPAASSRRRVRANTIIETGAASTAIAIQPTSARHSPRSPAVPHQHPRFGKRAAELAVRLVKRGRKYGIVPLFATQSPTKDSIPKEITRNVTCGVAFSVADWIANDGLLGSGRYAAGIRATELRAHTDRGTCVAVGTTDATFELIRTYYVALEDGADDVTPVVDRAMRLIAEVGRVMPTPERSELKAAPPDHLVTIAEAMHGERRVRTQVVLARLAALNPTAYEGWTLTDLRAVLAEDDVTSRKSDGVKVIRAEDLTAALARRTSDREARESQGVLPEPSLPLLPRSDQREPPPGTPGTRSRTAPESARNKVVEDRAHGSLPEPDGGGG